VKCPLIVAGIADSPYTILLYLPPYASKLHADISHFIARVPACTKPWKTRKTASLSAVRMRGQTAPVDTPTLVRRREKINV
jgi:hypothetical protein